MGTSDQVRVVAILYPQPNVDWIQLQMVVDEILDSVRAEEGNRGAWSWRSDDSILLIEDYVDADAVAAHRSTPHFARFIEQVVPSLRHRVVESYQCPRLGREVKPEAPGSGAGGRPRG